MSNSDRDAVNAIAQAYITATHEGDVEGFKKIFHRAITMNGYLGEQLVTGNCANTLTQYRFASNFSKAAFRSGGVGESMPYSCKIDISFMGATCLLPIIST